MVRYSNTERLGVIETDKIFTKSIGWIFREQPIVDVGLDALIEQAEEGDPKGKFLALQIKTGKSHFHITNAKLVHYVSNIHYNYWLNLDIPIIIVAHIPETEETYWCQICDDNFVRTKKRWKIEIHKTQTLDFNAKSHLTQILTNDQTQIDIIKTFYGELNPENLHDYVSNSECMEDCTSNSINIVKAIDELGSRTKSFNVELNQYLKRGIIGVNRELKAKINSFAKHINICARRVESEIIMFAELYATGIQGFQQLALLEYSVTNDPEVVESSLKSLNGIPDAVDKATTGILTMKSGVENLPNNFAQLKKARDNYLQVIELVLREFAVAKQMAAEVSDVFNSLRKEDS